MRLLRDGGALSRSDLARRSGLAKATVGTIIGRRQQVGAVSEGASESTGRGRPSTPVVLAGESLVALGLEVNVDYVATTTVDLAGRELSFEERPVTTHSRRSGVSVSMNESESAACRRSASGQPPRSCTATSATQVTRSPSAAPRSAIQRARCPAERPWW